MTVFLMWLQGMAEARSLHFGELPHSLISVVAVFAVCLGLFAGYWALRKLIRDGFMGGPAPASCSAAGDAAVDPSAAVCNCM